MNRANEEWRDYRVKIYGSKPLVQQQERECSLAFYAGMMTAFATVVLISDRATDEDSGSEELEKFRKEIDYAAARENLNRSDSRS